jgi:hypothetical protein
VALSAESFDQEIFSSFVHCIFLLLVFENSTLIVMLKQHEGLEYPNCGENQTSLPFLCYFVTRIVFKDLFDGGFNMQKLIDAAQLLPGISLEAARAYDSRKGLIVERVNLALDARSDLKPCNVFDFRTSSKCFRTTGVGCSLGI